MHRQPLLKQLSNYSARHPDESETVRRFFDFVEQHRDCFERSQTKGHVTGSAWVVDRAGARTLLTHHKKLNKWLQLGGHTEGDSDVLQSALREVTEESGLTRLIQIRPEIFDIDIHVIPARKTEPEHFHFDVRYALQVTHEEAYTVSDESHDLAWVEIAKLHTRTTEPSMLRMAQKWLQLPKTQISQNP